jgi:hypothetical protein
MVTESNSVMSRTVGRLCLAFEPSEGQADFQPDTSAGGARFVMIPNPIERTAFYLETVFSVFAGSITQVCLLTATCLKPFETANCVGIGKVDRRRSSPTLDASR